MVEKQSRELFDYSQALFDSDIHTLNIVHDVIVPIQVIAAVQRDVLAQYPHLTLNWLHRTRQQALRMLKSGEADIALMPNRGQLFPETEIDFRGVGSLKIKIYASKHSALSQKTGVTMKELQSETQYLTENFVAMDVAFAKVSPKIRIVSNTDLLCELLKQEGWAALPALSMTSPCSGDFIELSVEEMGEYKAVGLNLFYRHGKDKSVMFSDMMSVISRTCQSALAF